MNKKSTRGRRKGSVSFVSVTLAELNSVLKENGSVLVSRLWAESIGIQGKLVVATPKNMSAQTPILPVSDDNAQVDVKKVSW